MLEAVIKGPASDTTAHTYLHTVLITLRTENTPGGKRNISEKGKLGNRNEKLPRTRGKVENMQENI